MQYQQLPTTAQPGDTSPVAQVVASSAEVTLPDLVSRYGAQEVMDANDGRIPSTDEEIAAAAARLEQEATNA
jgi:hypothetical protein